MNLYLVQHGDAVPKDQDPARPLSASGRRDVEQMARRLAAAGLRPGRIMHSGKLRASETAEVMAGAMGADQVDAVTDIDPNDPVDAFAERLNEFPVDIMVVGHLPFMERLVSLLLTGRTEPALVEYRPGSVACLRGGGEEGWKLQWMLRPDMVPQE